MSFGITTPPVSTGGQFAAAKLDLESGTHTQGVTGPRQTLIPFTNVAIPGFGGLVATVTPLHRISITDLAPIEAGGDLFRYDLNMSLRSPRNMLISFIIVFQDTNGIIDLDQTDSEAPNNSNYANVSLSGLFRGPAVYGIGVNPPAFFLEYTCEGTSGNLVFRRSSFTMARV